MKSLSTSLTEPIFKTTCRVIYGDTDAAGVVYNANYLRYFEIGRTEMMREWALPYSQVEELGCVLACIDKQGKLTTLPPELREKIEALV